MNEVRYSQNNLVNQGLVNNILKRIDFSKANVLVDIGAGRGSITRELAKTGKLVEAIELDQSLAIFLKEEFRNKDNVKILNIDIDKYQIPTKPYIVFANIPFNKTADILKKILSSNSKLSSAYLVIQKEAAFKYGGEYLRKNNSMLSLMYGAVYSFEIIHEFDPEDFLPIPSVDCVLLKITRINKIEEERINQYYDFISYIYLYETSKPIKQSKLLTYNQISKLLKSKIISNDTRYTDLRLSRIIEIFNIIKFNQNIDLVNGAFRTYMKKQSGITKVNRTRVKTNNRLEI